MYDIKPNNRFFDNEKLLYNIWQELKTIRELMQTTHTVNENKDAVKPTFSKTNKKG
jgi:hypothetical protein